MLPAESDPSNGSGMALARAKNNDDPSNSDRSFFRSMYRQSIAAPGGVLKHS
jgi:hypothetical protein